MYNEQAAAAAPSSPTPQWRRALRLWTGGRNQQALDLTERLLPLWPRHALVWNARFMILAFTGRTGAAAAMLKDPVAPPANSHPARLAQWLPTLDAFARPSPARIARAREANLSAAQLNPGQATYAAMSLSQPCCSARGRWFRGGRSYSAASSQTHRVGAARSGCSCLHSQLSVPMPASKPCATLSD
jgi:hypothetical protein